MGVNRGSEHRGRTFFVAPHTLERAVKTEVQVLQILLILLLAAVGKLPFQCCVETMVVAVGGRLREGRPKKSGNKV